MPIEPSAGRIKWAKAANRFTLLAFVFGAAAAFHFASIARGSPTDPTPGWRHALFGVVNLGVVPGVLVRPRAFVWYFAALSAQQLYSHGTAAWDAWRTDGRVDWISLVVVLGMPLALTILARDARAHAERPGASAG